MNFLPLATNFHVEVEGKTIMMREFAGQVVESYSVGEKASMIPSGRGTNQTMMIITKSGDYAVVDFNHKFIIGESRKYETVAIQHCFGRVLNLSKLQSKIFPSLKHFFALLKGRENIFLSLKVLAKRAEVLKSKEISAKLWYAFLTRKKIFMNHEDAVNIRSIASVHGFNIKAKRSTTEEDQFKLKVSWGRKKKSRVCDFMLTGEKS